MEGVEVGPGQIAVSDLVHIGAVFAAPGVGERAPVAIDALDAAHVGALFGDTGTPIDDGTEHIEDTGPYVEAQS